MTIQWNDYSMTNAQKVILVAHKLVLVAELNQKLNSHFAKL